jgi:micrococcal nuclease
MFEYYVKKVTKIVDGDTIDVDIDLGFDISFSSRVRLAGIDTPESRTADKMEKALGLEAKAYLKNAIDSAKTVVIKTEKMDSSEKYGRILANVYVDEQYPEKQPVKKIHLNQWMLDNGFAVPYDGKTKQSPTRFIRSSTLEKG